MEKKHRATSPKKSTIKEKCREQYILHLSEASSFVSHSRPRHTSLSHFKEQKKILSNLQENLPKCELIRFVTPRPSAQALASLSSKLFCTRLNVEALLMLHRGIGLSILSLWCPRFQHHSIVSCSIEVPTFLFFWSKSVSLDTILLMPRRCLQKIFSQG